MLLILALIGVVATPPIIAPGRYAGHAEAGRVDLVLDEDGRAIFGGAAMRWRLDDAVLVLSPAAGEGLRLTLRTTPTGTMLDGSAFGPIRLVPQPRALPVAPPPPVRPLDWVGVWVHRATGGDLTLHLIGDGRYEMTQDGLSGVPLTTAGSWSGDADRLVLTPDDGAPLTYTARRSATDLLIGGGDLPIEVRFVIDGPR